MDAWPLAYACDNQMINLNVTEPSLKMGSLRAGPFLAICQLSGFQNLGLKAALLLGWSGALGTSGFLS
jgi:hypothetical protein